MDLIQDYWDYCSCYEIHRNYAFWSALSLIGAVVHRRVYFLHGEIEIHGNIYVLMVGPQGNGKTTCCDISRDIFKVVCPNLQIGASNQSAEDIVSVMSDKDFARYYVNELEEKVLVSPYAFYINEFKSFIAYNPTRMLNFLTDIYDRKFFDASTIKRKAERIVNPSINILSCENPDQLAGFMKNNVFSGGASRRFIIVNEIDYASPKPFIEIPAEIKMGLSVREGTGRVVDRLKAVSEVAGQFLWTENGKKFFEPWYTDTKKSLVSIGNPIMRGYLSTKHIQLFKICMLLDCVSDKPMFLLTDELLQLGLSFLDAIEKNMPRLSLVSGRNEAMPSQVKILDMLSHHGGVMFEKQLRRDIEGDFKNKWELDMCLTHLEETDQVVKKCLGWPNGEGKPIERWTFMTPERYARFLKDGVLKAAPTLPPSPSAAPSSAPDGEGPTQTSQSPR